MSVTFYGNLTEHFSLEEYTIGNPSGSAIRITKEVMQFYSILEDFRTDLGYPMTVTSAFRTKAYNKSQGGISTSNHLRGCACDWHTTFKITESIAILFIKIWKAKCEKHGAVGEAGLYTWGLHFGIQSPAQIKANGGKFVNWDSRSGKQIDNAFEI